ncbi:MAG: hypothetical protein BGP04_26355 [Rhizobiales bacterium 62-17]|nr:hypothetical protein [Hyphomicrobiales bacterium]OJY00999.1 MAG: hypothetical protein BGP04_26355 [Rhizobiales bacterium 62-17]
MLSKCISFMVGTLALLGAGTASAQTYPSQTIRIVVGVAPSTPPDILSRVVATELSNSRKWSVIVENRAGALQALGAREVLRSPADGYTLYSVSLPFAAAPALQKQSAFDLLKDFEPVVQLSRSYNVLVVAPNVNVSSVTDLIKLAKAQPNKMNFSSGGIGSPAHLVGELFKQQNHLTTAHVPYSEFAQSIADLLNGTNQYMFITTLPVMDLIASGQLRALAVTAPQRLPALKDIPTVAEAGFPNLAVADWTGILVKSGTPAPIVATLNAALNETLRAPAVRETLTRLAAEPVGGDAAAFGGFLRSEVTRWSDVIAAAGIRPQ